MNTRTRDQGPLRQAQGLEQAMRVETAETRDSKPGHRAHRDRTGVHRATVLLRDLGLGLRDLRVPKFGGIEK
jgi:hypothetical protein